VSGEETRSPATDIDPSAWKTKVLFSGVRSASKETRPAHYRALLPWLLTTNVESLHGRRVAQDHAAQVPVSTAILGGRGTPHAPSTNTKPCERDGRAIDHPPEKSLRLSLRLDRPNL